MAIMSSPGTSPISLEWYRQNIGEPNQQYKSIKPATTNNRNGMFYGGGLVTPEQPQIQSEYSQQTASGGGSGGYMPQQTMQQPQYQPQPMPAAMPMGGNQEPSMLLAGGPEQGIGPWWPIQYAWQVNNQQPWSLQGTVLV